MNLKFAHSVLIQVFYLITIQYRFIKARAKKNKEHKGNEFLSEQITIDYFLIADHEFVVGRARVCSREKVNIYLMGFISYYCRIQD